MMGRAVLLLGLLTRASLVTATSATGIAYILEDKVFPMADTDGDSKLAKAEFIAFGKKIDFCQPDETGADLACCNEVFGTMTQDQAATHLIGLYDTDSDGALTLSEMKTAAGISRRRALQAACLQPMLEAKITALFAPNAADVTSTLTTLTAVSDDIKLATATVETAFGVTTEVLADSDTAKCRQLFATATGVALSATTAKVVAGASARRRLTASAYTVTVTAYFADQASADAAAGDTAAMDTFKSELTTQMAAAGVDVDAASISVAATPIPGQSPLPVGQFASLAMVLGFLGISCGLAGCVSKSKAKAAGVTGGCCDAGCCSWFALKAWVGAKVLSAIVLLVACLLLFNQMNAFTSALKTIIAGVIDVTNLQSPEVQTMTADFATYKTQLDQVAAQLDLLPIAAVVPGLLATLMLLLAATCGFATKGPAYCCAKIPIFLSYLVLLLCLVLYIVLTAVAVAMYLPVTQSQIRSITSICDSAVPTLANTKLKLVEGIATADAAAMAVDQSLRDQVTTLDEAVTVFDTICAALATDLILAIEGLLFPCIFGLVATLWAWFNAFGLCCSEGCCGVPKQAGPGNKVSPAA